MYVISSVCKLCVLLGLCGGCVVDHKVAFCVVTWSKCLVKLTLCSTIFYFLYSLYRIMYFKAIISKKPTMVNNDVLPIKVFFI